jgi:adenylyltransferase/sulfurtransferase
MNVRGRHHRQAILPGVGEAGQAKLASSHAIIVGVGALGCGVAELLVRAGVGKLTLIDRDIVEATNLQRQCLYAERDLDAPKVEAAARRLAEIDSAVTIHAIAADFSASSAERLLGWDKGPPRTDGGEVLIEGTDNFDTRYLINDLAVKHGVPYVNGGVVGTRGTRLAIMPSVSACLRCVFPDAPAPGTEPTCDTAGVLGPAVATVTAGQASDAMRIMLGHAERVTGLLTAFDLWAGTSQRLTVSRDPACPCCGERRFEYLWSRLGTRAVWLCGQNSVQIFPSHASAERGEDDDTPEIVDLAQLASRLEPHAAAGGVTRSRFMVRAALALERADDGGPVHLGVFPDGRAVVRGVRNPERARSIYDRYVGA